MSTTTDHDQWSDPDHAAKKHFCRKAQLPVADQFRLPSPADQITPSPSPPYIHITGNPVSLSARASPPQNVCFLFLILFCAILSTKKRGKLKKPTSNFSHQSRVLKKTDEALLLSYLLFPLLIFFEEGETIGSDHRSDEQRANDAPIESKWSAKYALHGRTSDHNGFVASFGSVH